MTSVRRRRLIAASFAATATLALSACGTNFSAQTSQVYQPSVGANERGDVDVLGALLVVNQDGTATVSAGLVNNVKEEQDLSSVTATTLTDEPLDVRSTKGRFALTFNTLATLGGAADTLKPVVTSGATPGAYVKLTFTFSDTGPITVQAPVVVRTAMYANVAGGDGLVPDQVSSGTDTGQAGDEKDD